jgi:23S rRNA U2552 (ribose-2'-O)-methylase RlmE/FtsJ
MTYYLLPKTSFLIHKYIDCISNDEQPYTFISNSLSCYLCEIKEKLDNHENEWDVFKKYTNPYEYIHTVVPFKKKSISSYKPLSRSYFKMLEIMNTFNINFGSKSIHSFHLAEGPGGFIEALCGTRKNKQDVYIGMTILDAVNDPNIPAWKKSDAFLRNNENVYVECGADNTGNILELQNFEYCRKMYGSSMDFITADGGFDFSLDFNKQEISISKLLFAQVCFAVTLQKKGGTFVLKIFDCFMEHTVDILYILSSFYDKVYITKPQTSRYANSEKYIVCKDFLFSNNDHFYPFLHSAFQKMSGVEEDKYVHRFLNIPLSYYFTIKLEEYNAIFGQQQIENIHYTISLIENKQKHEKIDNLIKINIQKCIQWCMKHNVEYNNLNVTNVFLSSTESTIPPLVHPDSISF